MTQWKHPPLIKIYEALGAVADGRIKVSGNTGKVTSSSGRKYYQVLYDPDAHAIMANDNGSYWQGYVGYPNIAYLLKINVLNYRPEMAKLLQGFHWQQINAQYKHDYEKTLSAVRQGIGTTDWKELVTYAMQLDKDLRALHLQYLGKKVRPPRVY